MCPGYLMCNPQFIAWSIHKVVFSYFCFLFSLLFCLFLCCTLLLVIALFFFLCSFERISRVPVLIDQFSFSWLIHSTYISRVFSFTFVFLQSFIECWPAIKGNEKLWLYIFYVQSILRMLLYHYRSQIAGCNVNASNRT